MKKNSPELIVMLTHNDLTVNNAYSIFETCKNSNAKFWGFKDSGLPIKQMQELFFYMKQNGKKTFLEVVAYTEEECLDGAKMAVACGCDILMGTLFFESINTYCLENKLKYMPFVGDVSEHPSILEGSIDKMVADAKDYITKGAFGIDLLAYRYTGDQALLIKEIISKVDAPICIAGSINDYQKLSVVKESGAWAFTIGGAFFEDKFPGTFEEQINTVCEYIV